MDIDAKKLDIAILYLQRIADGNNPVNNMPAGEDSVLNNPNVIRCMYFVKEVLEEVKRNDGVIGRKTRKSKKAEFPVEALESFVYQEDKPITRLVEQINMGIDENRFQKIKYKNIQDWLKLNGYIEERLFEQFGRAFNVPTEKGERLGIRYEMRKNMRDIGYIVTIYGKNAQEYIVKNIEKIIMGEVED